MAAAAEEAERVRGLLADGGSSPTAWYAIAIAALLVDDWPLATRAAGEMRSGGDAFGRAADAIAAIADATSPPRGARSRRSRPTSRRATPISRGCRLRTLQCFSQHCLNVALGYPDFS